MMVDPPKYTQTHKHVHPQSFFEDKHTYLRWSGSLVDIPTPNAYRIH